MNKFDTANWKKYNPKAILPGRSVFMPNEYTSRLLLVRWTRANNTPETVGEVEAIIKSPFGTPATPRQTFITSTVDDYYEFWNVANEGLPYTLRAKLQQDARASTQLTVWEFIPLQFANICSQPPTDQGQKNMFSQPPTANPTADKGSVSSRVAASGSFNISPPNPNRMSGFCFNNSNKTLWVLFGSAPAAPAKPASPTPPGGNFEIPEGYVGAIEGAIAPGGTPVTGSVDLTEFNAT